MVVVGAEEVEIAAVEGRMDCAGKGSLRAHLLVMRELVVEQGGEPAVRHVLQRLRLADDMRGRAHQPRHDVLAEDGLRLGAGDARGLRLRGSLRRRSFAFRATCRSLLAWLRVGLPEVKGLVPGGLAPLLDGLWLLHHLDVAAVFGLAHVGEALAQHLLHLRGEAVVVGRPEQFAGEAAARHAGEVALWRISLHDARVEVVAKVAVKQVGRELLVGERRQRADAALAQAPFGVGFLIDLDADGQAGVVLPEEFHDVAEGIGAARCLDAADDGVERPAVREEADKQRERLLRRAALEAAVAAAPVAVLLELRPARGPVTAFAIAATAFAVATAPWAVAARITATVAASKATAAAAFAAVVVIAARVAANDAHSIRLVLLRPARREKARQITDASKRIGAFANFSVFHLNTLTDITQILYGKHQSRASPILT